MPSLSLDHDLGIDACAELKQRLTEHLHQSAPLTLDGRLVERVHTASLQLLCALVKNRQQAGLETRWVEPSSILCEAARLLGLLPALGLSPAPPGSRSTHTPSQPQSQDQSQDMEIAA